MKIETVGKYKSGDFVYAKENPSEKLEVRRYLRRIYFCTFPNNPEKKELALFERELV